MLLSALINSLGFLIFIFVFWKRLKEDYLANQLFATSFYILFGILVGFWVSVKFLQGYWFWLSFIGALFGLFTGVARYKMRFFEALEGFVLAGLSLFCFYLFSIFLGGNMLGFYAALVVFALIFLFMFFAARYKKFIWYRSGRIGFSGLSVLGIFFLLRCLVAIYFPTMLSFVRNDAIVSGTVAFACFIFLFNLSRQ